jgi:ABC-type lipoprotein release transport system permease subunit
VPIRFLIQLSVRNITRHKRRNLMLFAAIAVAVGSVSASNTLIRGFQADLLDSAISNLTGHIKIHAPGYRDDPTIQKSFELAQDFEPDVPAEELLGWAPRIRIPAVIMSERETRGIQLVGVDPSAEHISFLGGVAIDGESLRDSDDGRVLIGRELARQLETKIGRRLVIITQGADGLNRERGFRIAGTYDAEGTGLEKIFVFSGLEKIQTLLDTSNVTEVSVRLQEDPQRFSVKQLLADFFVGLEVMDWQELEPQMATMYIFADSAIFIWFALLMSALIFGLVNTLIAAVMERVREFGMLRALGMRKSMVIWQVVIESVLIMTIGVIVGLGFGYLLFLWLASGGGIDLTSFAAGMEMVRMKSMLMPVFVPGDFVLVAALSLGFGVLASLYPAWRAVKVKPLDALRR